MALTKLTRRPSPLGFSSLGGMTTLPALDAMDNRLGQFVERMFREPFDGIGIAESIGWVPAMDIIESKNELTLTAELAGIDQKDVDVSVDDGVLTIRGEKAEEREEKGDEKKVYLYERSFGSFRRSFALPANIDSEKVTANFDNGVLKVRLPKTTEAKVRGRKIQIESR